MPKRSDIRKIMIIGSGPIVIGQAREFDYSGTPASKTLRSEGYETVLVDSNPAMIMTERVGTGTGGLLGRASGRGRWWQGGSTSGIACRCLSP